ncbi:hypothetical protein [Rhizomicrobium electricum]|uniref:NTF2 fold domain-containing protein n=1 Tax=Rhizomicrobium electricum TaxID=480070 RepID=A0ABP3P7Y8_9PROT|nr:hypothetical protein [Rhizomicrobium electricum]NIJ47546.1 hypothetical protein [Rhizomicrobium electricum]
MPKASVASVVALCAALVGCANDPAEFRDPNGAIQDPDAALVIAHAMYWSVMRAHHPEILPSAPLDTWKKGCDAKLVKGVWDIWCPAEDKDAPEGSYLGGGLEIKIAKSGKLLSMVLYQ